MGSGGTFNTQVFDSKKGGDVSERNEIESIVYGLR